MPGYDYDSVDEEILLGQTKVSNGLICLDSGMKYRLLVLPDHKILSLAALKKVREIVYNGGLILGAKPIRTVSLTGYPQCDSEFTALADMVWGSGDKPAGENSFGKGKVIWGEKAHEALLQMGIKPDFEIQSNAPQTGFDYIHYIVPSTILGTGENVDMYFVCNQTDQTQDVTCTFRVAGRRPELWNPVAGDICIAQAFNQADGRTHIPMHFAPYGSWFVIFNDSILVTQQGTALANSSQYQPVLTIEGSWEVHFDPAWGGPQSVQFDTLISWTDHPDPGIQAYSGKATYTKVFNCDFQLDESASNRNGRKDLFLLDLGDVKDSGIASVRLNGKDLGIVWTKPFRVDISGVLRRGRNELEIDVINSWRNRLLADSKLPIDERLTKTNIQVRRDWRPLESGLLGPVQILRRQQN